MYRVRAATGINKKKSNQQPKEVEAYSTKIRNSMQILWQTACLRKILPRLRSICKRKNPAPKVRSYKKIEELKDTQVDRGGAKIFTLNTPTKLEKR